MRNYTSLTLIFLFGLILPFISFSQDLKIVYNAENGNMTYFQNGEKINKPIIKKGGLIVFKIENYNNYLYDIDFQETHETFKVAQGSGLLGGVEGLGGLENILSPIINFVDSDADGVIAPYDSEFQIVEGELSERQKRINQLEADASEKLTAVKYIEEALERRKLEVVKIEEQRELKAIALDEVDKIKYHPKIPPSKIKTYSKAFFEKVLDVSDINSVSLSSIMEKKSDKEELNSLLSSAVKSHNNYDKNIEELKYIASELESLNAMSSSPFKIQQKVLSASGISGNMTAHELNIQNLLNVTTDDDLQHLMNIWYEYEAISSNEFSTSFRAQGAGDLVNLDIKMLLKDSLSYTGAQRMIQLAPIKVPVYGGIKINASVGVNFGQYLKRPQTYFLKDSTIVGQNEDSFLPFITSFVHFYPQGRKSVSLGGSLGIGIPLSGAESGFQSTTFFLGPSLFFGNSERLVLNFGVMGGKVNRLSRGYEVGDHFDGEESFIPVKSLYELGFFTGLSFNISR